MDNFDIVSVNYKVYWRFKEQPHYKVTKCKKIINCQRGIILKQSIKGGRIGYYISGKFIKKKELNNHLEKITKDICPF
jgi:hypothetical protein